jgi:hypothetical protein
MPLGWSPPTQSTASSLPSTPQHVVIDGSNPTDDASRPPHVSEQQTRRNATYASDPIPSIRPLQDTDHQRERHDSAQQASHNSQNPTQHTGPKTQVHYQQPAVYAQPSPQPSASIYQGSPIYQSSASYATPSGYHPPLSHHILSNHQPSTVRGTYSSQSSVDSFQESLDPGECNLLVALFCVRTDDGYSVLCP